jgi:hypothetical protein
LQNVQAGLRFTRWHYHCKVNSENKGGNGMKNAKVVFVIVLVALMMVSCRAAEYFNCG